MNEEEVLKTINNMLLHAETQLLDYEALAIQGLLKLYNKEKEKNKEHKTRIRNLECKIIRQKEQISGLRSKYHVDAWLEDDYISKDKIKAKIEELDEEIKVKREIAKNPMDRVSGRLLTDSIVELEKTKKVLQSLLDKE